MDQSDVRVGPPEAEDRQLFDLDLLNSEYQVTFLVWLHSCHAILFYGLLSLPKEMEEKR